MSLQFDWTVSEAPKTTQLTGVESHDDEVVVTGRRGVLLERTAPGEWAAVFTDGGTVYRDISLFEQAQRTKEARFETSSPEEVAAAGDLFVIAGCDGCLVPITADGEYEHAEPGPGVTYYGADVTDDGDVIAVGSSGTITEGRRNS